MVLLKEIISNSIEEIIGSYIAYSASDSSTRLGKIDKDDLAEFVKTSNKVANGDLESLSELLDLTAVLFPNVISGEKRIELLTAIKVDLLDRGISIDSELLDDENIKDCIDYYKEVFEYENRIFLQLTSNVQKAIILPYLTSDNPTNVPKAVSQFIETLFNDYTINRLLQMIEFINANGSESTVEDMNNTRLETARKIHDLAESIALGKLNASQLRIIKENVEDVVSSAWSYVKEFNKLKDEDDSKEYQGKLAKTVINHISVVVEALSGKEDLTVESILKGLNVLIPLSAILSTFDKDSDRREDFKEAFKLLSEKINAVDLGEKKESIDGMISTIGSNINKYLS